MNCTYENVSFEPFEVPKITVHVRLNRADAVGRFDPVMYAKMLEHFYVVAPMVNPPDKVYRVPDTSGNWRFSSISQRCSFSTTAEDTSELFADTIPWLLEGGLTGLLYHLDGEVIRVSPYFLSSEITVHELGGKQHAKEIAEVIEHLENYAMKYAFTHACRP